jgi:hypothetical protein
MRRRFDMMRWRRHPKIAAMVRRWLLVIPYIGLLWVPFYNFREPAIFGIPFFYWYQLAWVPITAALTWLAYRSVRDED